MKNKSKTQKIIESEIEKEIEKIEDQTEYSNDCENIQSCAYSLDCIDSFDALLMPPGTQERFNKMKEKIISILEVSINNIYDELFIDEINTNK